MLEKVELIYVRGNQCLIGAMMILMFVLVFTNVVTRYGLGFSIAWAEEIASFLMIWVTYLGAGLALREGRHVAIDLLQDLLPASLRYALRIIIALIILAFFLTLTWLGIEFAIFSWDKETMVTQIPRGIPYLAIPVGSVMFILHLLFMFPSFLNRQWEESEDTVPSSENTEGVR